MTPATTAVKTLATALVALGIVGCSSSISPLGSGDREDSAQLAAYAATAKYPASTEARTDSKLATIIRGDTIKVINFSDQPVRDVNVWVNGAYVHKVQSIPPLGSVTLRKGEFYDAGGRTLADANVTATRVTVHQGDTLHATLGPVRED